MKLVIGILGAVAMVNYILGLALANKLEAKDDSEYVREVEAAALLVISGWALTFSFALVGVWGLENWLLNTLAGVAIGAPFVGFLLRRISRQWIPAIFLLLGLLATPVLYIMLLMNK